MNTSEFLQQKKELEKMLKNEYINASSKQKITQFFQGLRNLHFWYYLKGDGEYALICFVTEAFLDQIDDPEERKKYVEIILSTCPEELKHEVKKTIKNSSPLEIYFPGTYSFLGSL